MYIISSRVPSGSLTFYNTRPRPALAAFSPYAVVDADFYAPAASKEYLPVRRKRLLKIAVFGLVGEAPIIGARRS